MELWAFSVMELGILLIIILWAIQSLIFTLRSPDITQAEDERTPCLSGRQANSELKTQNSKFAILFLSLFLLLILFQMLPLPSGLLKVLSPKTYALHLSHSL